MGTRYECKRCGFSTHIRKNYFIHLHGKKPCKPKIKDIDRSLLVEELKNYIKNGLKEGIKIQLNPIEPQMNPIEPQMNPIEPHMNPIESKIENITIKKHICKYCKIQFSTNSHMHRHMRNSCQKKME